MATVCDGQPLPIKSHISVTDKLNGDSEKAEFNFPLIVRLQVILKMVFPASHFTDSRKTEPNYSQEHNVQPLQKATNMHIK